MGLSVTVSPRMYVSSSAACMKVEGETPTSMHGLITRGKFRNMAVMAALRKKKETCGLGTHEE